MNPLETQLRSWHPRRPAARLKRRLFGISFAPGAAWALGTLAPAAACALLTLGIFDSPSVVPGTPVHELVASNWTEAALVVDGFADKQNHWSSVTFDSTNHSGSGSIMGSLRH